MTKYKVSAYLTDKEVKLLDSLAMQWECSKSQAIIKAIKSLTNSEDNPIPTPKPIPTHSVNVGLSKEDIELLIEQKIELLVNSRIELLETQGEENAKKFSEIGDRILKIESEIDAFRNGVGNDDPPDYSPIFVDPDPIPDPDQGLKGQELAALISEQGVNCRLEYLSLYKKGRHIPPKVKEVLDRNWIAKGKYWYQKQSTL